MLWDGVEIDLAIQSHAVESFPVDYHVALSERYDEIFPLCGAWDNKSRSFRDEYR